MTKRVCWLWCAGVLLLAAICGCSGGDSGPPCEVAGCDGARLCEVPEDPSEAGPWPVGARTVEVEGLTVEVWYPGRFGSQKGQEQLVYDVRVQLPEEEQGKIPDEDNPWQVCDCFGDLPIDARRGPYPVMIFIHGTAGYRMQSLQHMLHWASRGFVVLAADHPGLCLADMLQFIMDSDLEGDVRSVLAALGRADGELQFLAGRVDLQRIALSGHSAGGMAVGSMGGIDGVRVVIPMAAAGVEPAGGLQSAMVMGGMDDTVVEFERQRQGYLDSPAPKRLVGIANAGHLVFTDMCAMNNDSGQNLVEIAVEHGVTNASLAELMFDGCEPHQIDPAEGWRIVNYATAAALEESLHCADRGAALSEIRSRFELVGEYDEELSP